MYILTSFIQDFFFVSSLKFILGKKKSRREEESREGKTDLNHGSPEQHSHQQLKADRVDIDAATN